MTWLELAEGVYARRYEELDLTVGLVVGTEKCLVIDTRGDVDQGAELAAAVREITPLPWIVAYTHAHFDHAFGTTPFLPCDVWAAKGCLAELETFGDGARRKWAKSYRDEGKPEIADALDRTRIEWPDRVVETEVTLDLGGRSAVLINLGHAHTDHDLIVHVPDAGVVFAGDTVENGPAGFTADSFGVDNDLTNWPAALDRILALCPKIVVPGHGEPVGPVFVAEHRDGMASLSVLDAAVTAGELTVVSALARSPYPEDVTRAALSRNSARPSESA
ncbi:MBL fold metallo-hydrolase [Amycolatopsis sp. cg5]|uniref:MBL fold metallo-hydrolase n=1 Tax=Amycolatopsis sp. cg5 TaxID=3238802 RepID=UPI003523FB51